MASGVIDGRGLQKVCNAWDDRCTRCDTLVFRARPTQACKLRTRISFFKLCVHFASLLESLWRSQRGRVLCDAVGVGSHAAAAIEFPAPVHSGESSPSNGHRHKRPVAGSRCAHLEAEHRLHLLELSNRSVRQDSATLSKQVAYWRSEAKRSRVYLQLHEQDTIKHGKKSYFSRCEVALLLHCEGTTKGGIGAAALADLQQIDTCKPSIFELGNSG